MVSAMGARVVVTTESGQYVDGEVLNKALGWGGVRSGTGTNPGFVLHGDDAGDLTNSVHWDKQTKMVESFKYSTGPAKETAHHNWATGALLQDQPTGLYYLVIGHHSFHEARGTSAASAADKIREKHTQELVRAGEVKARELEKKHGIKKLPILFLGDFNQDKDDFYDGPGRAMAAAGYVDVETVAAKKSGPETTYPNLPPLNPSTRRLDRIFVKAGTPVAELKTVEGPPYTDHNGVVAVLTITND